MYQWPRSHAAQQLQRISIEKPSNCIVTVSYSKENMTYWKTKVACTLLMLHNPLFCL